jgi:hypothetical protein
VCGGSIDRGGSGGVMVAVVAVAMELVIAMEDRNKRERAEGLKLKRRKGGIRNLQLHYCLRFFDQIPVAQYITPKN